jgi:1,4-alpha-glucan branching enzyme
VYFVVHAPHAAWAELVLVVGGARQLIPMSLTPDARYWWCAVSSNVAIPGTQYRFVLNDDLEVLDPAAREVEDRGTFDVAFGADPSDATTAWSLVSDIAAARALARAEPWQTMGWQNLSIYEMHAARFTDLSPGGLKPLDLLVDELNDKSRLGQRGYLKALPVTAFELLPVQEFSSDISWGYDPSFYFAVDGHYGANAALARFVNAAHANGRAVLLDVVYNHSLGSSLMKIAPDVYRNGDYDGDRMNCGHPMVLEFLRQATLHLWWTFGIDGFRFDDTHTIVTMCQGGWEFLGAIRASLRIAATATGQAWPYCVAENTATSPWDISNPGFGVMDGQWGIDEVYRIRDASYDTWNASSNDADPLAQEMNKPAYWGRPFHQAVRFGESHDMVSAQDSGNKRIAARPPFGQGLQMAKAMGALTLLSNGVPMLFMGQEYGEIVPFSFDSSSPALNPQSNDAPDAPVVNVRVLAWFRSLMGLRNDPVQGLQGDTNYQVVQVGHRTVAFTCGTGQCLFAVVTFGTANQQQDSSWLGLPAGSAYKEIFNSSWPVFAVEGEPEHTNGGYDARIVSGRILELPYIGAVVLQRA